MLLIDNDETKRFKGYVLLQKAMGTNKDIDLSVSGVDNDFFDFRFRKKTRQTGDSNRLVRESIPEGFKVLLGKKGRWGENRSLFTV